MLARLTGKGATVISSTAGTFLLVLLIAGCVLRRQLPGAQLSYGRLIWGRENMTFSIYSLKYVAALIEKVEIIYFTFFSKLKGTII